MISQFVSDILDKVIIELKKNENMNKIHKNLIDPLIYYTFKRIYPYLIVTAIIFILTFILAILILIFLIKSTYKKDIKI
tara:strand:- start:2080 stop:2316 length:237 start_codon:yes stop_codon:yes gene_type:complete